MKISSNYDYKTFTRMGYILVDNQWCNKDSIKPKSEPPKINKISADSAFFFF